ncbi:MAG: hypothetical protein NDI77_12715 [Geobacteraceae bacterium]|nr:hypothetical protein [Geobacteraceae bacterium]
MSGKNKSFLIYSVLLGLMLFPGAVYAEGIADTFYVESVRVDSDGKGYVNFTSPLVNTPAACTNGYPNALAFDVNTVGGKAIMSLALTAKATGKRVYAKGKINVACEIYGVMEDWGWGRIID